MNPIRLISKQNAKAQSFDGIVKRRVDTRRHVCRGRERKVFAEVLSGSDAALALAGLDRKYYLAARIKWLIDTGCIPETAQNLRDDVFRRKGRGRVGVKEKTLIQRYTELAVLELAYPAKLSLQMDRARFFGIGLRAWQARHSQPYREIYDRLDTWCHVALGHVSRKLDSAWETAIIN